MGTGTGKREQSGSTTASSRQMDVALMNHQHRASTYADEYRALDGELQFVATGTRPSRSPTPELGAAAQADQHQLGRIDDWLRVQRQLPAQRRRVHPLVRARLLLHLRRELRR